MTNKYLSLEQVQGRVAIRDILGFLVCAIGGLVLGIKIGITTQHSLWPILFGVAGWAAGAFFWRLVGKYIFRSSPKFTIPAQSASTGMFFFFAGGIAGDYVSRQVGLPVLIGVALCAVIGFVVGGFLGAFSARRGNMKEDERPESK